MFAGQLSIVFILVEDYLMHMLWAVFAAAAAGRRHARAKQSDRALYASSCCLTCHARRGKVKALRLANEMY
jgi:cytochrome c553